MASERKFIADGVYTVVVTPFNNDGGIDWKSLEAWTDMQVKSNVTGIVALGTTSESPTLNAEEQLEIVENMKKWINGKKKLVVGIGGNNTKEVLKFAQLVAPYADALMATVPCYNKPDQDDILEHFKMICNDSEIKDTSILLYNVPGRTGKNMEPDTISKIFYECENVVAIKEASGSMNQIMKIRSLCPIQVFSGDDKLVLDVMVHGGSGVISVASNVVPNVIASLTKSCLDYDFITARESFYKWNIPGLCDALFCCSNPKPIKYLLHRSGVFSSNHLRKPLNALSEDFEDYVWGELDKTREGVTKSEATP
jgi:4-hydroxy-tetrahydrodipicolinate synthase